MTTFPVSRLPPVGTRARPGGMVVSTGPLLWQKTLSSDKVSCPKCSGLVCINGDGERQCVTCALNLDYPPRLATEAERRGSGHSNLRGGYDDRPRQWDGRKWGYK